MVTIKSITRPGVGVWIIGAKPSFLFSGHVFSSEGFKSKIVLKELNENAE